MVLGILRGEYMDIRVIRDEFPSSMCTYLTNAIKTSL
jgi:hypothetical protein